MANRIENDAYYSESWIVDALLKYVDISKDGDFCRVVEPSAGSGVISNRLKSDGFDVVTCDVDPETKPDHLISFFDPLWGFPCDWIITNPPYQVNKVACAAEYARLACARASDGVALFLRLSILEPCADRVDLLTRVVHGKRLTNVIVCPRISFTGDGGNDTLTCAWFVWEAVDGSEEQARKVLALFERMNKAFPPALSVFTRAERDRIVSGQADLFEAKEKAKLIADIFGESE